MKLFILALVAISVGFSAGNDFNSAPQTKDETVTDLETRFDIKPQDMNLCREGPDYDTRIDNAKKVFKALSAQVNPTVKALRNLATTLVKGVLPCVSVKVLADKVDFYGDYRKHHP